MRLMSEMEKKIELFRDLMEFLFWIFDETKIMSKLSKVIEFLNSIYFFMNFEMFCLWLSFTRFVYDFIMKNIFCIISFLSRSNE
jgi:hypothetical protein